MKRRNITSRNIISVFALAFHEKCNVLSLYSRTVSFTGYAFFYQKLLISHLSKLKKCKIKNIATLEVMRGLQQLDRHPIQHICTHTGIS